MTPQMSAPRAGVLRKPSSGDISDVATPRRAISFSPDVKLNGHEEGSEVSTLFNAKVRELGLHGALVWAAAQTGKSPSKLVRRTESGTRLELRRGHPLALCDVKQELDDDPFEERVARMPPKLRPFVVRPEGATPPKRENIDEQVTVEKPGHGPKEEYEPEVAPETTKARRMPPKPSSRYDKTNANKKRELEPDAREPDAQLDKKENKTERVSEAAEPDREN